MRTFVFGASLAVLSLVAGLPSTSLRAAPQSNRVAKILADARQALGGEARLSAVKGFTLKGDIIAVQHTRRNMDMKSVGTFEIRCELPDKFVRIEDHWNTSTGETVSVEPWDSDFGNGGVQPHESRPSTSHSVTRLGFNGEKVIYDNGSRDHIGTTIPLPPPPTQAALRPLLPNARQYFVEVTLGLFATSFSSVPLQFLEAPGTEDGTAITVRDKFAVTMRFDANTHLPAALGSLEYSDYRDVSGLKMPFKLGHMVPFRTDKGSTTAFEGLEIKQAHISMAGR